MSLEKTDTSQEKIVIPLFEIVVYPDSRAKFQVDLATGQLFSDALEHSETAHAVGLCVKSGIQPLELTEESFYTTGTLLQVLHVQPADDGYLICAQVVQRVEVISFLEKGGRFYATYEPVPDIQDLEKDQEIQILDDIKTTINDISNCFTGSEEFTRPIEEMDSIDQIMGFIMPFLPVSLTEKQNLLEIVSIGQRYSTFLVLLIKTRDDIAIRIEMAKKVSARVNKSNREAMLRE